ncbi:nuclear transport factor 2 family protein [Ferrimonas sp. YFM]|uniref:nuclear transport factor 2 family protein n=1 Tax=Ferrimonas sp. YFM TaxID=3028878 RepID=UPI002574486B|nr:nuclear transport factor 2 family protein [Ferrimonas sp. YFM]BDY04810.1 transcriptional regulator [Ferrimonas sp. YFM]
MIGSSPTPAQENLAGELVERFVALYEELDHRRLYRLGELYHPQACFIDPLHRVEGLDNLTLYFEGLYRNLKQCRITVHDQILTENQAALYWTMEIEHSRLNGGRCVRLDGHSHLKFGSLIHYHRDYFDAGQMLYEQLPLLGTLVKAVKKKAAP